MFHVTHGESELEGTFGQVVGQVVDSAGTLHPATHPATAFTLFVVPSIYVLVARTRTPVPVVEEREEEAEVPEGVAEPA